jgi:hypothetical protein
MQENKMVRSASGFLLPAYCLLDKCHDIVYTEKCHDIVYSSLKTSNE